MKWIIVAFEHPDRSRSVLYRQGLDEAGLLKAVSDSYLRGANLMSIRGVPEE